MYEQSTCESRILSVFVRRCKGKGGPNAFEQHMALQLAKVRSLKKG